MKYCILAILLILSGCGKNDAGLAKTMAMTKNQKANIEERIKPFGIVNVSAEPTNWTGPQSGYMISGAVQVAQVDALPGEAKYLACGACHGAQGGGGVGPALAGQTVEYIVGRLNQYKAGEKVGSQSNLMWSQAAMLSETDIQDLAEYIKTL